MQEFRSGIINIILILSICFSKLDLIEAKCVSYNGDSLIEGKYISN